MRAYTPILTLKSAKQALRRGDVSALPYDDESFDKVYSIHSIYFWPGPVDCLGEVRRVHKPGGLAAIAILSREQMLKMKPQLSGFSLYSGEELVEMMEQAGFINVRLEEATNKPGLCVIGVRR